MKIFCWIQQSLQVLLFIIILHDLRFQTLLRLYIELQLQGEFTEKINLGLRKMCFGSAEQTLSLVKGTYKKLPAGKSEDINILQSNVRVFSKSTTKNFTWYVTQCTSKILQQTLLSEQFISMARNELNLFKVLFL